MSLSYGITQALFTPGGRNTPKSEKKEKKRMRDDMPIPSTLDGSSWMKKVRFDQEKERAPEIFQMNRRRTIPSVSVSNSYPPTKRDEQEYVKLHEPEIANSMQLLTMTGEVDENFGENEDATQSADPCTYALSIFIHKDIQQAMNFKQKQRVTTLGLRRIEFSSKKQLKNLGREQFLPVFTEELMKETINANIFRLSRQHCTLEYLEEDNQLFVTDTSSNGLKLNAKPIGKNTRHLLDRGDVITLLESASGEMVLGYIVERDESLNESPSLFQTPPRHDTIKTSRRTDVSKVWPSVQKTLGVLFAAPLAGKDARGCLREVEQLDLETEYATLTKHLSEATKLSSTMTLASGRSQTLICPPVNVKFDFATTSRLRSMITGGCQALHFSGHGTETHLYFEDGFGGVHPVPNEKLRQLIEAGGDNDVRFVFVSACSSEPVAKAFVNAGVPHVIAVKVSEKIEDKAAIAFTGAFYHAVASGKTVYEAFGIAKQTVSTAANVIVGEIAAEKFQLLPLDADHSEVLFPRVAVADYHVLANPPKFPVLCPDKLPTLCQSFSSRSTLMFTIMKGILYNPCRLVTVTGEPGIGKTNVAFAVARYLSERRSYDNGVHVLHVDKMVAEVIGNRSVDAWSDGQSKNVLEYVNNQVRHHLDTLSPKDRYGSQHPMSSLLVLDAVDYFHASKSIAHFRTCIAEYLTRVCGLRILITARHPLERVPGYTERQIVIPPFDPLASSRLLISLTRNESLRPRNELPGGTTKDAIVSHYAKHRAVLATGGNPGRIADLAAQLQDKHIEDLVFN